MTKPRVTVVIGSTSEKSRSKVLALAIAEALARSLPVDLQLIELATLGPQIGVSSFVSALSTEAHGALRDIETTDLLVVVSPVYKGSYTGWLKHLFDLVAPDALVDKPVLLAANGGSDRHALMVDHQLRPLFSFFRAQTVPSAVYASEADFDGYVIKSAALHARIDEAVRQAARLLALRQHAPHVNAEPLHSVA